ncbi:hypothetical protein [Mesorhizobium sp. WSM4904]|uniref:hypothetical protein n=1 Tax=Mesorhizobium sp. WSM4904 TaxID=3038545 RepID=UPI002418586C|nr:hypothetical protein [Mesorhizobium sp. WSM4904]WFP61442.1 hypothetical protein QAZ47_23580 [Mesorhizobium sp. WSM4904]
MKNYLAAALAIGITTGPAAALDVGGKVGGLGVSAGVSAGSGGVSVGVGASVDGVGGANVGTSVGTDGSLGAGVSTSGNLSGVSAGVGVDTGGGVSAGVGVDTGGGVSAGAGVDTGGGVSTGVAAGDDPSAGSAATSPRSTAAVTPATALAKTTQQPVALPPVLRPSKIASGDLRRIAKGYPFVFLSPLKAIPGTPAAVVRACRAAITASAKPLGAVRVYVASAGLVRQRRGGLTAPIEVRIDYDRQGGIEVRQAKVGCRLDVAGKVTTVI